MSEENGSRLTRVEEEVGSIKTEVNGLKVQLRGFGDILNRIEDGVKAAQQQWQDDKQSSKLNPVAFAAVLVTIMSILVGGAWTIGDRTARTDTHIEEQQRSVDMMVAMRDRELNLIEQRLSRLEGAKYGPQPNSTP